MDDFSRVITITLETDSTDDLMILKSDLMQEISSCSNLFKFISIDENFV